MKEHTQGEWTASPGTNMDARGSVWVRVDEEPLILVRGKTPIESRANAELCAGAPEMLKALQGWLSLYEKDGILFHTYNKAESSEVVQLTKKALEKVKP